MYVVALANGTAMGGGVGLLAVCDYVVMKHSAMVALSEVCRQVNPCWPAEWPPDPVATQRGAGRESDSPRVFTQVKLGVIPATISPYVVAKVGPSRARRLFMTGEAIRAEQVRPMLQWRVTAAARCWSRGGRPPPRAATIGSTFAPPTLSSGKGLWARG